MGEELANTLLLEIILTVNLLYAEIPLKEYLSFPLDPKRAKCWLNL